MKTWRISARAIKCRFFIRLEHAFQRIPDIIDNIINDIIATDLERRFVQFLFGIGICLNTERHDDRLRHRGQNDVGSVHVPDSAMNEPDGNFLVLSRDLEKRIAQGFNGTLHVTLDDHVKFPDFPRLLLGNTVLISTQGH